MDNSDDMLQLCRLCLVKDDVKIPIFEEQGDIRQIFLKISSCLPVKVSREDKLPKKICDGCSYKLDMLYEFWNTTANAEKQLLSWLGEAGMNSKMTDGTMSAVAQQIKPAETFVKQEAIDPSDIHTEEPDDDKSYMFQQKFTIEEAGPSATVTSKSQSPVEEEEPPRKRARRTAAVKAQIAMDPESDDDEDSGEPLTKVEDESEDSDGEDHEPAFVDVPSTSADDQPGPSGVGRDGVETPCTQAAGTESKYVCLKCHKIFISLQKLKRHSLYHKEKRFHCDVCGNKFVHKCQLNSHKQLVHCKEKKYECDLCRKIFSNMHYLKVHLRNLHTNAKKHVCGQCGKNFYHQKLLETHEQFDHEGMRHTCEHCKKKFKTKAGYREHMKTHDPNFKRISYTCTICLQVYSHKSSFRHHLKFHEGDINEKMCDICGKVLTSSTSLRNHIRIHSGEKPLQCDICDKRFTTRQLLRIHYRIHTKEKPFTCQICEKSFSQKPTLTVHMRYHTGEKPYSCLGCSKRFVTKTILKNHQCNVKTDI